MNDTADNSINNETVSEDAISLSNTVGLEQPNASSMPTASSVNLMLDSTPPFVNLETSFTYKYPEMLDSTPHFDNFETPKSDKGGDVSQFP